MKKRRTRMGKMMDSVLIFSIIVAITYGFMSLIFWDFDISTWSMFARIILGAEGVAFIIALFHDI